MKKEISDHLAEIFFEKKKRSSKHAKKPFSRRVLVLFFLIFLLLSVAGFKLLYFHTDELVKLESNIRLVKHDGPYRVGFDFRERRASRVETFTLEMPEIDLRDYRKLRFSLRLLGEDSQREGTIKVSLINARKEISSLYVQNVGHSWTGVEIPCENFQSISDWSNLRQLAFSLEEWNIRPKKGSLLIDEIEFVK